MAKKNTITKYCPTCRSRGKSTAITYPDDEEPDFFVYLVKNIGSMKYVVDYAFCSEKHIRSWLRRQKQR